MSKSAKAQATRRVSGRGNRRKLRTPRPRTGGRSARVVAQVLSATLELFAEQGYAGLSVEAVAARAGVNKTTVYRRWPTKTELLGAALVFLREEDPPPPDTGTLQSDLEELLSRWAEHMATPRRRAIMQALLLGNSDPEVQALVRRVREQRPAIPSSVFERAVSRGELPKGSNTQLISAALLGALHSRTHWKYEPVDLDFVRSLVRLVLRGAFSGGAR